MHVVIVDENNNLIADLDYRKHDVIGMLDFCEVDFFENDIRIRIKKDIITSGRNITKVEFYEDKDTDSVSAHFRSYNG